MFSLQGRPCELCDGVAWEDTSGQFTGSGNTTGYGGPGAPTAYTDFTTYTLEAYKPGTLTTGTADLTVNLLTIIPVIDADGDPRWTITADALDQTEPMISGVWFFRATAVFNGTTYTKTVFTLFTLDIQGKIDSKIIQSDPLCACQEDCNDAISLDGILAGAKHQACCGSRTKAQEIITFLYSSWSGCC